MGAPEVWLEAPQGFASSKPTINCALPSAHSLANQFPNIGPGQKGNEESHGNRREAARSPGCPTEQEQNSQSQDGRSHIQLNQQQHGRRQEVWVSPAPHWPEQMQVSNQGQIFMQHAQWRGVALHPAHPGIPPFIQTGQPDGFAEAGVPTQQYYGTQNQSKDETIRQLLQRQYELWEKLEEERTLFRDTTAKLQEQMQWLMKRVMMMDKPQFPNFPQGQHHAQGGPYGGGPYNRVPYRREGGTMQNGGRYGGQYRANRQRGRQGYYPPPNPLTPADDTPYVNEYIENTRDGGKLDLALKNKESLAVPGSKVKIVEHEGVNIVEVKEEIKVHAIASDLWTSSGAAKDVTEVAGKPNAIPGKSKIGEVIRQEGGPLGTVFHLVTKMNSPDKLERSPETFLRDVKKAQQCLAKIIKEEGIEQIAMTYLNSGLDRLNRLWVMNSLYTELTKLDCDVTLHFYGKYNSRRWQQCGRLFDPVITLPEGESEEAKDSGNQTGGDSVGLTDDADPGDDTKGREDKVDNSVDVITKSGRVSKPPNRDF